MELRGTGHMAERKPVERAGQGYGREAIDRIARESPVPVRIEEWSCHGEHGWTCWFPNGYGADITDSTGALTGDGQEALGISAVNGKAPLLHDSPPEINGAGYADDSGAFRAAMEIAGLPELRLSAAEKAMRGIEWLQKAMRRPDRMLQDSWLGRKAEESLARDRARMMDGLREEARRLQEERPPEPIGAAPSPGPNGPGLEDMLHELEGDAPEGPLPAARLHDGMEPGG